MTTTSYLSLPPRPAGRPATPARAALALGFISESSGILASSHKAEGQPSRHPRAESALRAPTVLLGAGATTGRRTVQRDDGLDGGQRGGAAGSGAACAARSRRRRGGTAAAALAGAAKAGECATKARFVPYDPWLEAPPWELAGLAALSARARRRAPDAAGARRLPRRAGLGLGHLRVWLFALQRPRAAWLGLPPLWASSGRRARAELARVLRRGPDARVQGDDPRGGARHDRAGGPRVDAGAIRRADAWPRGSRCCPACRRHWPSPFSPGGSSSFLSCSRWRWRFILAAVSPAVVVVGRFDLHSGTLRGRQGHPEHRGGGGVHGRRRGDAGLLGLHRPAGARGIFTRRRWRASPVVPARGGCAAGALLGATKQGR